MKKLEIIIPHEELAAINDMLYLYKATGMSFYEIKGRGRTKTEPVSIGRGNLRYVPEFAGYTKVEAVVSDDQCKLIVEKIMEKKGKSYCPGRIFVYDVVGAYDLVEGSSKNRSN